ncbi:cellulose-growth-specific protein [Artomyces pyxidatus]|uniref:Cellulose-growth-specific protein n=1 Tax=Artomyces pyxidatus TaxID=48021 RepID=A0ACB8TER3_9AGAM|nr:cellulose-growth-specific protein [Artomyces pyxidatus]
MLSLATLLIATSAVLPTAFAHGGVLSYSWGGQWYWGWQPYNSATGQTTIQRPWSSYNPITSPTDPTIACNDNGAAGALQLTGTVAAGTPITAYWNQVWPHAYGPMLTYLANCGGSCTGVTASTLKWFKIDQSGLINGTVFNGFWGDGLMIAQNSSWTTTIPSTVPAGNYLIRFETIALHSLPAQFYPECAQIQITGGGTLAPTAAELVTFPGGYSTTDPGLTIDIYGQAAETQTTYPMPGPPLYGSGSSGSAPSGPTTTSVAPSSSKVSSAAPTSSAPSTPGTVAEYGQCGGSSYTGPTACVSPYKCTVSNAYYSQCLP